jgi:hypothetical protein
MFGSDTEGIDDGVLTNQFCINCKLSVQIAQDFARETHVRVDP